MFTPQEVRQKSEAFEKAVFGGYSMSSVDDFVARLSEDYAALYKENAVLKSKMKVLVQRLEEYHGQEESLNKAIVAAQKTADDMVVEAERTCAKMMSDTEQSLRQRNEELKLELAAEAERVARAKKTAAAFVEEVENQVHQSLSQLERIRQMTISAKSGKKAESGERLSDADKPEDVSRKISESIQDIMSQSAENPGEAIDGSTKVISPVEQ